MYDGHHENWPRADAEAVLSNDGRCEDCADHDACKAEGACIRELEIREELERERS